MPIVQLLSNFHKNRKRQQESIELEAYSYFRPIRAWNLLWLFSKNHRKKKYCNDHDILQLRCWKIHSLLLTYHSYSQWYYLKHKRARFTFPVGADTTFWHFCPFRHLLVETFSTDGTLSSFSHQHFISDPDPLLQVVRMAPNTWASTWVNWPNYTTASLAKYTLWTEGPCTSRTSLTMDKLQVCYTSQTCTIYFVAQRE